MCFKCKHIRCICKKLAPGEQAKMEYANVQLFDNAQDFAYVKGKLEKAMGTKVPVSLVVRHALILALKKYNSGAGVQILEDIK